MLVYTIEIGMIIDEDLQKRIYTAEINAQSWFNLKKCAKNSCSEKYG